MDTAREFPFSVQISHAFAVGRKNRKLCAWGQIKWPKILILAQITGCLPRGRGGGKEWGGAAVDAVAELHQRAPTPLVQAAVTLFIADLAAALKACETAAPTADVCPVARFMGGPRPLLRKTAMQRYVGSTPIARSR